MRYIRRSNEIGRSLCGILTPLMRRTEGLRPPFRENCQHRLRDYSKVNQEGLIAYVR